ncbi:response regulator transcription factor [Sphingomonas prati]|uniref:DNA-binding NarL/FixJ family response regulator n=1 Tax=Sphingomonas prati TaxID=1843237 RepID=A0A7W9BVK1_9SPHN|nr:response regulator transcription factor [Sphingomonas prati]MBB5730942.1 DNA-binding NarL/FixJ family response regulator [Sphingomonas prati]GGE97839.1 DNA-binding response regulator [Sphingomonas prati]
MKAKLRGNTSLTHGGGHVLVIDDHPVSREGLSIAVRANLPDSVVIGTSTIAEAIAVLETEFDLRLLLIDLPPPYTCGLSGFFAVQRVAPSVPVVIVTGHEEPSLVKAAKAVGASGVLSKRRSIDELAAGLRKVLTGSTCFPSFEEQDVDAGAIAIRARIAELTRAQHAVLVALAGGKSNKVVAWDLAVTEATVKAHLTAIFRKLGVTNRTQALLALGPSFQLDQNAPML